MDGSPLMVMPLMTRSRLPVLLTDNGNWAGRAPMFTLPKAKPVGEAENVGPTAAPDNVMTCGLPLALSWNVTAALRAPRPVVGLKTTLTCMLPCGGTVMGNVPLLTMKSAALV